MSQAEMILQMKPALRASFEAMTIRASRKGLFFLLSRVGSHWKTQAAYYAQGREPLSYVNQLRKDCQLAPLKSESENFVVTWTLDSPHIINLGNNTTFDDLSSAFDVYFKTTDGRPDWNTSLDHNINGLSDWMELGKIGEECGLDWGGRFKDKKGRPRPDYAHFQLPNWRRL